MNPIFSFLQQAAGVVGGIAKDTAESAFHTFSYLNPAVQNTQGALNQQLEKAKQVAAQYGKVAVAKQIQAKQNELSQQFYGFNENEPTGTKVLKGVGNVAQTAFTFLAPGASRLIEGGVERGLTTLAGRELPGVISRLAAAPITGAVVGAPFNVAAGAAAGVPQTPGTIGNELVEGGKFGAALGAGVAVAPELIRGGKAVAARTAQAAEEQASKVSGLKPHQIINENEANTLRDYADSITGTNIANRAETARQAFAISKNIGLDISTGAPTERVDRIFNYLSQLRRHTQARDAILQGGYIGPEDYDALAKAQTPEEVQKILQGKIPEEAASGVSAAAAQTKDPNIINKMVDQVVQPARPEARLQTAFEVAEKRGDIASMQAIVNKIADPELKRSLQDLVDRRTVTSQGARPNAAENDAIEGIMGTKKADRQPPHEFAVSAIKEAQKLPAQDAASMLRSLDVGDKNIGDAFYRPVVDPATHKISLQLKDPTVDPLRMTPDEVATRAGIPAETAKAPTIQDVYGQAPEKSAEKSAAQQVVDALSSAKNVRAKQEASYSAERAQRIGAASGAAKELSGSEAYRAKLAQLEGSLKKQEYTGLKDQLSPQKAEQLYAKLHAQVEQLPISEYSKLNTQTALRKVIFGEGGVPTTSEIKLLQNAFGDEFAGSVTNDVAKHQEALTVLQKAGEVLGVSRAMMASADFSGGLRQALAAATRHPIIFAKNFVKQFEYFGSEKAFQEGQREIQASRNFDLMSQGKLAINDLSQGINHREEQFASSLAERIPALGRLIRASDRAYTGLLNQMRANIFNQLVENYERAGIDLRLAENAKAVRDIARVVNTSTGRGDFGNFLEQHAGTLSSVFFSPRLMASRVQLFNPAYYIKLDPIARKEALTTLLSLGAFATTVLGAAKLAGFDVGTDPRSSDFGKVKVGDTRFDFLGGYAAYLRLGAQLATGQTVSSLTGHTSQLGQGYGSKSRKDIIYQFLENKENPILAFATTMVQGKDATGNSVYSPQGVGSQVIQRFVPLVAQDFADLLTHPGANPVAGLALSEFGVGTQTYGLQDIQLSQKQQAYVQRLQDNGASPQQVEAVTRFYQTLKSGPDRAEISNEINQALARGEVEQARQLAAQYNQDYTANFKKWADQYADYSNTQLVKDYRAGKINLTASNIRTRLKTIKANGG